MFQGKQFQVGKMKGAILMFTILKKDYGGCIKVALF